MPIPSCLLPFADIPCWVGWTAKRRYGKPKADKIPINPHTGRPAAVNNPRTWGMLDAAKRLAKVQALPGIGIVSAAVPELVFVDLDDCLDPSTGAVINNAAEHLLDECGHSYAEITPSLTGLRIIGTAPDIQASFGHKGTVPSGLKLELYKNTARFLTVTGGRMADHPDALGDIGPAVLDVLPLLGASRDKTGEAGTDARETSELVRRIVTGEGYHNELCALAARLMGQNVPAGIATNILQGLMLASLGLRDERWTDRYYSIDTLIGSAVRKFQANARIRRDNDNKLCRYAMQLCRQRRPSTEVRDLVFAKADEMGISEVRAHSIAEWAFDTTMRERGNAA